MLHLRTRFYAYLVRRFGLERRKIVVTELLGRTHSVVEGTLRVVPDYDDAWLLALAHDARCVFDVGSNIGQSSLLLLWPDRVESIVIVEANPNALVLCAENLIRNRLSHRARFVCAFASDRPDEEMDFFTVGAGAAGSMYRSHARTAASVGQPTTLRTVSLDSIHKLHGVLPDLVKIDVEGAEIRVLFGATKIAAIRKTRFFVEVHSNPDLGMRDNAAAILDWCGRVGYRAWYLKDMVELENPMQVAARGRCHLLLLPSDSDLPNYLTGLEQGASLERAIRAIDATR